MQAITKNYLLDIIGRLAYRSIHLRRQSKENLDFYDIQNNWPLTGEEIVEFIFLIPFFDERLKDFLLGNIPEHTIIISQAWETEFIVKCNAWIESSEWLHADDRFLGDKQVDNMKKYAAVLTLPY